jgi:hypothetical protein
MCFPLRCLFLRIWPGINSMRSPVIADPIVVYRRITDNDCIIDIHIMNDRSVHIHDSRIISKRISLPVAAAEARSIITISIIHAAIKSNMRSPVPMMKTITASCVSPIGWCPQKSGLRWKNPNARHPKISVVCISPVSRYPEVAINRTSGLDIYRQWRRWDTRFDADTDTYLCLQTGDRYK